MRWRRRRRRLRARRGRASRARAAAPRGRDGVVVRSSVHPTPERLPADPAPAPLASPRRRPAAVRWGAMFHFKPLPLPSFGRFLLHALRGFAFSAIIIFGSLGVGIVGYHHFA